MASLQAPSESARLSVVEYRVLGPVSAFLEAKPRQLGGKRQRTVLAILLSRPNQVVSQDWLIDAVWAGEPPAAARQTLHAYVSTLRKELNGGIEREADGYVVHVENGQLDSLLFDDLVEEGRSFLESDPIGASSLLQDALALWQGSAFGDLNGEPALINEVSRLEEARLTAIEYRIEADLGAGNHQAVVQELEALTREHPFRERLQGFLMLALYRSGRQADALRSYRRAQMVLAEELGIDPSPELQSLEEKILNQSSELAWSREESLGRSENRAARGYELREKVDENRYGVTHRGFQGSVGREVAVLSLNPDVSDNPDFVRRFESELQAVSQLDHPHIVPIYDYWRDPDGAFLVTAYLRGGPLSSSTADGPWNLSSTLRLVDQIGSALGFAHRNGFIHGSLAIDSIGLDSDANAYITDFGLPVLQGVAGTRSPGDDVVALARLAFVLLAGENAASNQHISEIRADLAVLDPVFDRAFHRDPASRFQKPEDFRRAIRQAAGTDVVTGSPAVDDQRRNPYKGLRAFQESDASDFHGRDALVEDLIEILATQKILTVVGPSGSGKSSLVRAGLLSALRTNAIDGSGSWLITEMFPGTHPFEELEAAILRVAVDRPAGLVDDLTADARGLVRIAKQVLPNEDDQLLLVVDQFEELFSLTTSESDRKLFVDTLVAAVTDERSRIRVVLTLRADFFDQPLRYSNFGEVLGLGLVPVGAPTDDGLARAVAQPARDVGVDLEPGLVTRIVDDVRDEPGGLPLLQYSLTELFAQREHNTLTLAGYERSGGVLGALGKRAEEIYSELTDDGKEAARHLFLRLVTVDELADDTRRRVRQTELKSLEINQASLDDVISRFGSFRLLSFDRDAATRTPTVEVAHEALIREWDRLRTWIDDRREDLLIHRRIQVTSRDWEDSNRDPSYLLRGNRLEQALQWQERTDIAISTEEMTLIEASIEQEKRELAELEALESKASRRRKAVIGVLAGGLLVAGVLGFVALDRAQSERVTAAQASARDLSSASLLAIQEDPELAILLALQAIEATDNLGLEPVPEAASAIREAVRHQRVRTRIPTAYEAIEFSPDGLSVVADEALDTGAINRWNLDGSEILANWNRANSELSGVAELSDLEHSPDGDLLVATWADPRNTVGVRNLVPTDEQASSDRNEMVAISIHDPRSLELRGELLGERGWYWDPTFSGSGFVASYFLGLDKSAKTFVWDPDVEEAILVLEVEEKMSAAQFIPGTDIVVTSHLCTFDEEGSELPGLLIATEATAMEEVWRIETPSFCPSSLSVSPDGSLAVLNDRERRGIQVWDLKERQPVAERAVDDGQTLRWSPDSSRFAASGNDGNVTIFERDLNWEVSMTMAGHDGSVFGTDFHPDGESVASASLDGSGLVWDTTSTGDVGDRAIDVGGNVGQFFMGSDGQRMSVGVTDMGVRTFDIDSGFPINELPLVHQFHYLPTLDLSIVAALKVNDENAVLDPSSGEVLFEPADCLLPLAVSQDQILVVVDASGFCPEPVDEESEEVAPNSQVVDLTTGEERFELGDRRLFKAMFSPQSPSSNEPFLVVNAENSAIEIYSINDFELIAEYSNEELDNGGFLTLAIDPEGRFIGLGTSTGSAVVIDVAALYGGVEKMDAVVFNRRVGDGSVPQVRVSSQGMVATSDFAGLYKVFDLESGEVLFEIRDPGLKSQGAAQFTWDGTQLAYEDALGNIRFTPLDTYEVVEQAKAVLTRTLTDDECTQYLHTDGCEL